MSIFKRVSGIVVWRTPFLFRRAIRRLCGEDLQLARLLLLACSLIRAAPVSASFFCDVLTRQNVLPKTPKKTVVSTPTMSSWTPGAPCRNLAFVLLRTCVYR